MIAQVAGWSLRSAARLRRQALERVTRSEADVQERTLLGLVARAQSTKFGREHDFGAVRSVGDYQSRVRVREYLGFRTLWARALAGEEDVTWPGRPRYWVKTSGTTAGDKLIPVTPEAFASHRRGGLDSLLMAAERAGGPELLGGPMLFLGGSTALRAVGAGCHVGDLSGLVVRRLPPLFRRRYSPGAAIAAVEDWEARIDQAARLASGQDLRLIAGMPSWLLIFLKSVREARRRARRSVRSLGECWPRLKVLVHGGVAFPPYREAFEAAIGRPLARVEVYPASEGFVGLQTETSGGLTLMLDYGIFYEFVPVESLAGDHPRRHTVADVELGRPYAVVMTTSAGLWSYVLGDTVRFTARDPLRLEIVGRVRHFVNAFGENVIVEEVERAMVVACQWAHAEAVEFTVAPRYPSALESRGGHDWVVEFRRRPESSEAFAVVLDQALQSINTDYRTKRRDDVGMLAPRVIEVAEGGFYRWMRDRGKLGDQHKVPRVTNSRAVVDDLFRCLVAEPPVSLADRGDA